MFHKKEHEQHTPKWCRMKKDIVLSIVGILLLVTAQLETSKAFMQPLTNLRQQTNFPQLQPCHQTSLRPTKNIPIRERGSPSSARKTQLHANLSAFRLNDSVLSIWYLSLLALQFGCQPLLTKAFTPSNIIRSTVVLAQDVVRFILSFALLVLCGSWGATTQKWTMASALVGAGIPSILYLFQNYFTIMAYQNLPPITFNVLNQTKTLSAALCCFLIMGRQQSRIQIVSLFLLLLSALVIEKVIPLIKLSSISWLWQGRRRRNARQLLSDTDTMTNDNINDSETISDEKVSQPQHRDSISLGVVPVLLASFISGLAGALSQKNLQQFDRNSYLFSMEISIFSIFFLVCSVLLGSPDGKRIMRNNSAGVSILEGWTWKTWIPILTNASGGIVVGLVTKKLGAVRKGFALIFGLLLSGILQNWIWSSKDDGKVTSEQLVGGILAGISLWLHSSFPPILRK